MPKRLGPGCDRAGHGIARLNLVVRESRSTLAGQAGSPSPPPAAATEGWSLIWDFLGTHLS